MRLSRIDELVNARQFINKILQEELGPLPGVGANLYEIESYYIKATLQRCEGSIPKAAKVLGCSARMLQSRMKAWRELRTAF